MSTDEPLKTNAETSDQSALDHSALKSAESVAEAPSAHDIERDSRDSFSDELISVSVKAVAVALSLVILILSLLVVIMPLSAMRAYNKLGMSERALNSGDRYISKMLDDYGADSTDGAGNYMALSKTRELSGSEFVEALDVCSSLAYELMEQSFSDGDEASTVYFARKLEKYTRIYASLYGVRAVNADKNTANLAAVPSAAMRPYVYSYAHTVMVRNFRARVYMNELDGMLYDSGRDGECVQRMTTLSNTFSGLTNKETRLDEFVDYVDQLGEYISVELKRLGVSGSLNEAAVRDNYSGVMKGNEFSLFLTQADGFTDIYNQLKNFGEYAQAAVNVVPSTSASELDNRLHQLYRLQILSSVSRKLWYMSMLTYFNADRYGVSAAKVREEYGTCERYMWVKYKGRDALLSEVYQIYLEQYLALCNA